MRAGRLRSRQAFEFQMRNQQQPLIAHLQGKLGSRRVQIGKRWRKRLLQGRCDGRAELIDLNGGVFAAFENLDEWLAGLREQTQAISGRRVGWRGIVERQPVEIQPLAQFKQRNVILPEKIFRADGIVEEIIVLRMRDEGVVHAVDGRQLLARLALHAFQGFLQAIPIRLAGLIHIQQRRADNRRNACHGDR